LPSFLTPPPPPLSRAQENGAVFLLRVAVFALADIRVADLSRGSHVWFLPDPSSSFLSLRWASAETLFQESLSNPWTFFQVGSACISCLRGCPSFFFFGCHSSLFSFGFASFPFLSAEAADLPRSVNFVLFQRWGRRSSASLPLLPSWARRFFPSPHCLKDHSPCKWGTGIRVRPIAKM